MIVAFWLEGEQVRVVDFGVTELPVVGDRVRPRAELVGCVVAERWLNIPGVPNEGWHIVLRRPETPAESTPPWKRKEE